MASFNSGISNEQAPKAGLPGSGAQRGGTGLLPGGSPPQQRRQAPFQHQQQQQPSQQPQSWMEPMTPVTANVPTQGAQYQLTPQKLSPGVASFLRADANMKSAQARQGNIMGEIDAIKQQMGGVGQQISGLQGHYDKIAKEAMNQQMVHGAQQEALKTVGQIDPRLATLVAMKFQGQSGPQWAAPQQGAGQSSQPSQAVPQQYQQQQYQGQDKPVHMTPEAAQKAQEAAAQQAQQAQQAQEAENQGYKAENDFWNKAFSPEAQKDLESAFGPLTNEKKKFLLEGGKIGGIGLDDIDPGEKPWGQLYAEHKSKLSPDAGGPQYLPSKFDAAYDKLEALAKKFEDGGELDQAMMFEAKQNIAAQEMQLQNQLATLGGTEAVVGNPALAQQQFNNARSLIATKAKMEEIKLTGLMQIAQSQGNMALAQQTLQAKNMAFAVQAALATGKNMDGDALRAAISYAEGRLSFEDFMESMQDAEKKESSSDPSDPESLSGWKTGNKYADTALWVMSGGILGKF